MRCDYCRERILVGAVRCKHCGYERHRIVLPRDVPPRSRLFAAGIGILGTAVLLAALNVFVVFVLDLRVAWFAAGLVVIPPALAIACCRKAVFSSRARLALALLAGLVSVLIVSVAAVSMEKYVRVPASVMSIRLGQWAQTLQSASPGQWFEALYPTTPGQWRQVGLMLVAVSVSWFAGSHVGTALNSRAPREHGADGLINNPLIGLLPGHSPQGRTHPHASLIGGVPKVAIEWLFALLNAAGYGNG